MKGKKKIQQPIVRNILAQMQKSGKTPSLSASLRVEFNKIPFCLHSNDGKAILKFKRWSEAVTFFMEMRKYASASPSAIVDIRHLLNAIGLTVYLQNSRFAILGPQAGILLPGLLSVVGRFNSKNQ